MSEEIEKDLPKSFITLQLDTGTREFRNLDELQEWASNEREFFAWLKLGANQEPHAGHAWKVTETWIAEIDSFIQKHRQPQVNKEQRQNFTQHLHDQLNRFISEGHILTSQNPDALFGKNLSEEKDNVVACYAMNNLLNVSKNNNSTKALLGGFLAFQYKQGSVSTVEAQAEALEVLRRDWDKRLNDRHMEIRAKNETLNDEICHLRGQFSNLKAEIESQKDAQHSEFQEKLKESEKSLSDIERTYDEKLALQSSVNYWRDKRTEHTKVMWKVGRGTLILALGVFVIFIFAALELLQVKAVEVELWRLGVMLAISTFGIWITRLAAQIFISNLHLRTDADERVTMIQTYLALLREGSGPKEDERQLILQTLFRPSSTGFIKDDGSASFHELIAKALSKK